MAAGDPRRIDELIHQSLRLAIGERNAFIDKECAEDPELRHEVHRLLDSIQTAERDGFLVSKDPIIGTSIGPYRVARLIAEGGLGAVYQAEQVEPIRRMVALKVIRPGFGSAEVIARFEAERQALALMDHPHIASIYDAGTTPNGLPFFAMEYVSGLPLTRHADNYQLTIEERLTLFAAVCEGVHHAHQKGVIHRDLKPSNILVSFVDGRPFPKIIDFGIAKALNQRLTDATIFTHRGMLIGTPVYMSPEQAEMSALEIDARSDIYSLGVILYELLTGQTPLDARSVLSAAVDEIRRMIREIDPPKPSTRLGTLGKSDPKTFHSIAMNRRLEGPALARRISGDLDALVLKALDKNPARRHRSAVELASDVEAILQFRPLSYGPPGAVHRLAKFVRRNRRLVTAASIVGLSLVSASVISTAYYLKEKSARAAAQTGFQFLSDVLTLDTARRDEKNMPLFDRLDWASRELPKRISPESLEYAKLALALGRSFHNVGEHTLAEPLLKQALAVYQNRLGAGHREALACEHSLTRVVWYLGRNAEAEQTFRRLHEQLVRLFGSENEFTLSVASDLGQLLTEIKNFSEAESLLRTTYETSKHTRGTDDAFTQEVQVALGELLSISGKPRDAESLFRSAFQELTGDPSASPVSVLSAKLALGRSLLRIYGRSDAARMAEAETLIQESYIGLTKALGDSHWESLQALEAWADAAFENDQLDLAQERYSLLLGRERSALGDVHRSTLETRQSLARIAEAEGDLVRAEALYRELMMIQQAARGPHDPETTIAVNNLGTCLYKLERVAEAAQLLSAAHEQTKTFWGPSHLKTAIASLNLASVVAQAGDYAQAKVLYEDALTIFEQQLAPGHRRILDCLWGLATLHFDQKHMSEAEAALRKLIEPTKNIYGEESPEFVDTLDLLARCVAGQGRMDEAETLFRESLRIADRSLPDKDTTRAKAHQNFGVFLRDAGRFAEAEPELSGAAKTLIDAAGLERPATRQAIEELIKLYEQTGNTSLANEWRIKLAPPP